MLHGNFCNELPTLNTAKTTTSGEIEPVNLKADDIALVEVLDAAAGRTKLSSVKSLDVFDSFGKLETDNIVVFTELSGERLAWMLAFAIISATSHLAWSVDGSSSSFLTSTWLN